MRSIRLTLLVIMLMAVLLGCSGRKPAEKSLSVESEETASVEAMVPSREAVLTFAPKPAKSDVIKLYVGGEPVLLASGYVRLGGVVSGEKPAACLEVGGRGLTLAEGEKIDDYRIIRINGGHVVLKRQ